MSDFLNRLTSRKFLLALATVLFTIVQMGTGAIPVDAGLQAITAIVIAYLAAEGAADTAGRLKPSIPIDPSPTTEEVTDAKEALRPGN